jgi:hypothetical protein
MLSLRADHEARDAGVTLIELVVGMTLTLIIGLMALAFFVSMDRASNDTIDSNVTTAGARNVIEAWTRLLSLADSPQTAGDSAGRFQQITPTSAVFYANMNNNRAGTGARTAPTKVSLSVEGGQVVNGDLVDGQLVERDYAPLSPVAPSLYPNSPTRTLHYSGDILLKTGDWLFAPYRIGDPPQPAQFSFCSGDTAQGLCAGDTSADAILPTIVRVDVSFVVQTSDGHQQSYTSSAYITGSKS